MPDYGEYLWEWFWEIIETEGNVDSNGAKPVSHVALRAWAENTETLIRPFEFKILAGMSVEWAAALNIEIEAMREQAADNAKRK